jgi:integrase
MARPRKKSPAYRLHKPTGQAVVTLADPRTGVRRDHYLGRHGTAESHARYAELLRQYQDAGQVVDAKPRPRSDVPAADTVGGLILDYWKAEKARFGIGDDDKLTGSLFAKRSALRACRQVCGRLPVDEFGPKRLQEVRDAIAEQGLTRTTVNAYIRSIIGAFKWGVAEERVRSEVVNSLACVRPLRRGEKALPEGQKVKPVPLEMVDAVQPFVADQVWALIQLQILTGARPGELVGIRPCDIDQDGELWRYRPEQHKTAWRERSRVITFGPKAQAILAPFIEGRADDACLFSPKEAEAARRAKQHESRKSHASTNKSRDLRRQTEGRSGSTRAGEHYTTDSYRKAIERACVKAFPLPDGLDDEDAEQWRREHCWTPHRLRHNAATLISHEYDVTRAKLVLDHSSAELTDAIYAERDRKLIDETILKIG